MEEKTLMFDVINVEGALQQLCSVHTQAHTQACAHALAHTLFSGHMYSWTIRFVETRHGPVIRKVCRHIPEHSIYLCTVLYESMKASCHDCTSQTPRKPFSFQANSEHLSRVRCNNWVVGLFKSAACVGAVFILPRVNKTVTLRLLSWRQWK